MFTFPPLHYLSLTSSYVDMTNGLLFYVKSLRMEENEEMSGSFLSALIHCFQQLRFGASTTDDSSFMNGPRQIDVLKFLGNVRR